jgi:hypothetical protein
LGSNVIPSFTGNADIDHLIYRLRILLRDNNPDRNYRFRPPSSSKFIQGQTQVFGFVWEDDCIEVFMDTKHDHEKYFHVISNIAGVRFDAIGRWPPLNWDGDWQVAIAKYKDRWIVEIAIPFSCMNIKTPMPGEVWGFNLNREERRLTEMSGWSPTWYIFHEPKHFGHLIFEPES